MTNWTVNDADRELFARELDAFVPDAVFDAHAHLYSIGHFPGDGAPELCREGPADVGAAAYQSDMRELLPGRRFAGLFFPFPYVGLDVEAANRFLIEEVRKLPGSHGQMLITPAMDPEQIRQTVREAGFVGLKCYHVYSNSKPTFDSSIEDFLPEPQVRIAHEERLSITLHIVKSRALAEPANQETIRRYATRYPDLRLILAHAARGFNPYHTIEGITELAGLDNVWFDTSAVTECGALEAIIRVMGHRRVLYGSDFPVSHVRGRCVAIGDSFVWLDAESMPSGTAYATLQPCLVGLESLRVHKLAALHVRLSDTQVEDVFHNNAAALFER